MPGCSGGRARRNTHQLAARHAATSGQVSATCAVASHTTCPAHHSGTKISRRTRYWPTHTQLAA